MPKAKKVLNFSSKRKYDNYIKFVKTMEKKGVFKKGTTPEEVKIRGKHHKVRHKNRK